MVSGAVWNFPGVTPCNLHVGIERSPGNVQGKVRNGPLSPAREDKDDFGRYFMYSILRDPTRWTRAQHALARLNHRALPGREHTRASTPCRERYPDEGE